MKKGTFLIAALASFELLGLGVIPRSAKALFGSKTFTVNSLGDTNDNKVLFDTTCADSTGKCTLRAAIEQLNVMLADTRRIVFDPAVFAPAGTHIIMKSITDPLKITQPMAIEGPGATVLTIDGSASMGRIFTIDTVGPGVQVTISGLTLTGGSSDVGGAIFVGVGETLNLRSSIVTGNTATERGGGIAIYSDGTSGGTLNLTDSTVNGNSAAVGGGISVGEPDMAGGARLTVKGSTISHNEATNGGGGIVVWNSANAEATLENTTISGNTAKNYGGGILAFWGTLNLNSVTIANNTGKGGGISRVGTTVKLKNTIIGKNVDISGEAPDCFGTLNSQGYNLIQNTTGCTFVDPAVTGDLMGVADPGLAALADSGGPTKTHALTAGSRAIDAGEAGCKDSADNPLTADQRGVGRVGRCDIGAYEFACGNGTVDLGEECDDANAETESCAYGTTACTICDANCKSVGGETSFCGDSVVDTDNGETCDDGNTADGDGCSAACRTEVSGGGAPAPAGGGAAPSGGTPAPGGGTVTTPGGGGTTAAPTLPPALPESAPGPAPTPAGGGCSCAMNDADGGLDPKLLALLGLMVMPLIWKRFRKV